MAENRMFEVADVLSDDRHEIEHRIEGLRQRVHQLVCESGRMPIEQKTQEVLGDIATFIGELDFAAISEEAQEVGELKSEIDGYERELAEARGARKSGLVTSAA